MMLDYILAYPEVWDQSLMACLMRRESPAAYMNIRSGCDRRGITTEDLNASTIIQPLHGPAASAAAAASSLKGGGRSQGKSQVAWHLGALARGSGGQEEPDLGTFTFAVFGNDVVVSAPYPFIFHQTVAVHVLTDKVNLR